ncbi:MULTISPECIES: bifunctional cobalt-precorrin-7 (C(5))-methyltransferase/cobalt-precorrin-6B (C(15))-methyltransferase [Sphingobium]|uniref:Bifunctional cobalt-precorrin-7 (C(5))-methyltransferase/cobalt-precorrin-6B (C(15))-methyltransferase n=1 Tax=Sphingobium tyrosinilyticum TaxID=2715436 RepID=A0ABV9EZJ7_9SPHN|nr:bifunctional cobalt-precorrin-7 (C(5))-methyltransferase/cobalt-precorrin-6B (C(15))-methyltransferase [Sphingobium sp. EP60837]ANI79813.1 Precorrin-6B C(5,15)-methyltransferase (decarboxylating) [Sphingobium sp. EP60837]
MAAESPWLTIIGIGEDGAAGLSSAAHAALEQARIVTGAPRQLALLPPLKAELLTWPVPFDDGVAPLLARRGEPVVLLASGDPFWFGAGASIARHLDPSEWIGLPAPSSFSIAAARLGWSLQDVVCHGLHAAPLARLRRDLVPGGRAILLLRDGAAVGELATYLVEAGFGASTLYVMESLGGPRERIRAVRADAYAWDNVAHPVAAGIAMAGDGEVMPRASGIADSWFEHDGQITKRPVRALTLSALAPLPGETLWDIGAGSGSVAIEWLLCGPRMQAIAFEADPVRAARGRANAARLGGDRLSVIEGRAPAILEGRKRPNAIFVGGGLSEALLEAILGLPGERTRLVANAVTLESEALLAQWQARLGGELLRIEMASAAPLGTRRGWKASYPLVQWSVTL